MRATSRSVGTLTLGAVAILLAAVGALHPRAGVAAPGASSAPSASSSSSAAGAPSAGPAGGAERTEAIARVVRLAKLAHHRRYLEGKCRPTTYPGWEGFPVKRCRYRVQDADGRYKRAEVVLLNPSPEQLARWVVTTCLEVKGNARPWCTDRMLQRVLTSSGGQFPVAGVVWEDILPTDGRHEAYCFRDGLTVRVRHVPHRTVRMLSKARLRAALHGQITRVYSQARLQGTSPEDYKAAGGKVDVGTTRRPTKAWLEVSRKLYQAAWGQDRNELMIAWARRHLY